MNEIKFRAWNKEDKKMGKIMKAEKYNMQKREDVVRWFSEMESYLRFEDFIHQGTDLKGRKFALDGFHQLKRILTSNM